MDSIQNQSLYDKCKKTVKLWECNFMKSHGRTPSKLDIREAGKEVRNAYCMYFKLKTAALEKSLLDIFDDDNETETTQEQETSLEVQESNTEHIENELIIEEKNTVAEPQDEVWGEHLNKQPLEENKPKSIETKKENLNSVFTQKLFKNSKFMKRNPRKSFTLNKSSSLNLSETFSQPEESSEPINSTPEVPLSSFNSTLPVSHGSRQISSQSLDVISQLLDSKNNSIRHVDKGWLQRVSINTGTKLSDGHVSTELFEESTSQNDNKTQLNGFNSENNSGLFKRGSINTFIKSADSIPISSAKLFEESTKTVDSTSQQSKNFDSDDIISDSDEEMNNTLHLSKRIKLSSTLNISSAVNKSSISSQPQITSNNINQSKLEINLENKLVEPSNASQETINIQPDNIKQKENVDLDESDKEIEIKTKKPSRKITSDTDSDYEEAKPQRKRKRNVKTTSKSKETPRRQTKTRAIKSKEPNNSKDTPKESVQRTNKKRTAKSKEIDKPEETPSKETEEYEMEYSVKPPPSTVPRYNIKKILTDNQNEENAKQQQQENTPITKETLRRQVAKSKLLKKIESGNLNDNFVRIDIKKKVFVRGKKHINFSKFKKNLWKSKKKALYGPDMDMGGCDGGELTCFKCGKTGHMARNCKEEPDKLLPLDAFDEKEECLLPSLEEASKMARESLLAVRTPNQTIYKSESNENQDITSDINDKAEDNSEEENKDSVYEFEDDDELESFMMDNDFESEIQSSQNSTHTDLSQKWAEKLEENDIKPIYELNADGSIPDTPQEVFDALKQFGHSSFRSGQEQAVMRILCGQSTLVTLSTGSGKSLCYQLPAFLYAKRKKCVTLVISPLVSLMEDQVSGIASCLKAACLHTMQTATQKDKVLKLIDSGDLDILLVSPEAVTSGEKKSGFGSFIRKLPPIAFACIDEAHCVSQWSHNFRPSYLVLCRVLRERLGIQTVLGLTATSTYATSSSIVEHLKIPDGRTGVISDIPLPDNLYLSISSDMQRDAALRNLLNCDPFNEFDSIIVYCTRREECERIASYLRTGIRVKPNENIVKKYKSLSHVAEPYHAGLPASKRRTVQNAFMSGYLRIVVATVAFGMGINKANIRGVIHYNMPRNFESYVQEVGRAGRDGLPAHCHLFLDNEGRDQNELRRHIYANSMDRHVIRKLLKKIFVPCECKNICPRHEVAFSIENTVKELDVPEENISTLLCYLELHEKRYLEVLTPVYTHCKIISYGGAQHIKHAAKDCPPLAMALALQKQGEQDMKENIFEFPVVDIAAAMGWDSGIVKSKLKNLEWATVNNMPKRSALTVEFSNLGFHVRAPGNLPPSELDETLDTLYEKKKEQELTALQQLQVVHNTLTSVTEKYYHLCLTEKYLEKSTKLKNEIRKYFSCEQPLKDVEIVSKNISNEQQIAADVRSLVAMYRDNTFTGRAAARIFHGIQSPNYPAVIWGRCKFWRAHLNSDFNKVCQISTAEILRLRYNHSYLVHLNQIAKHLQ